MLRPLRRADRKVSRKQYGSNNYNKAKHMRARLYERIYNKRHDFLHNMSSIYAKRYDLIFIERLQLTNMVKNHHLARAMLDSGFGYFKQMLQYKAKIVVDVNPAYTSIQCSGCHEKVPKSLAVRTHRCPYCRLVLDCDHNSSIVIEQLGRVLLCLPVRADLPQGLREVTPVELQSESLEAGRGYRTCLIVSSY